MSRSTDKCFTLPSGIVHLWHCHFDDTTIDVNELRNLLSDDERKKAERYKFDIDRRRCIIARGVLRRLLGRYLEIEPKNLSFGYTEYGKPFLKGDRGLRFNLSHSHQRAVFAFVSETEINKNGTSATKVDSIETTDTELYKTDFDKTAISTIEIGVDIERIKHDFDVLNIARHFFSSDEIRALEDLPEQEQAEGFYRCWTRKESFIKAKGSGLSFSLTSFSVSLDRDTAELRRTEWHLAERNEWRLFTFRPSKGYQGALSVRGTFDSIEERDWNASL